MPARVPSFVNRSAELAALDRHAAEAGPGIAVVVGGPGSGKTALALHWAHRIRTQFRDGDLFVNLRGYDAGSPPSTDAVLDGFLRALNVPPGHIPADTDAKAALYRSLLAERRVLIVLDNAADAEQVRALLPGSDGCATVITSRSRLAGLTAREGAARMDLAVLPEAEATELLRMVAGSDRIDEAPSAAAELASLCGYLPLALRIAGDYLASHPFEAVIDLVEALAVEGQRLESLGDAEQAESVRAVFSWSYRGLPGEWARAFRLLGLHVGHDIDIDAAAALLAVGEGKARRILDGLAGLHLITQVGRDRFGMHDLLRAYAAELAAADDDQEEINAAATRLFQWFLHTATKAAQMLPQRRLALPDAPDPTVLPRSFDDQASALAWCELERANLVSVVRAAADRGLNMVSWQLAMQLGGFYNLRKHWNDWIAAFTIAVEAAERADEAGARAWLLTNLGIANRDLRRFEDSLEMFRRAIDVFVANGDRIGEQSARNNMGSTLLEAGRPAEALPLFQTAAQAYRDAGNRQAQGRSLSNAGTALTALGQPGEAVRTITEALELLRATDDQHGVGFTLHNLGEALLVAGDHATALEAFETALPIRINTGNLWGEARTRLGAGKALLTAVRIQEAIGELEAAQRGFEETGTPVDTARVALVLAKAYAEAGDLSAARKILFQATWLLGPTEQSLAEQLDQALTALSGR